MRAGLFFPYHSVGSVSNINRSRHSVDDDKQSTVLSGLEEDMSNNEVSIFQKTCLVVCLIVCCFNPSQLRAADRSISGRVIDSKQQPIANIQVIAFAWDSSRNYPLSGIVTTQSDGRFHFTELDSDYIFLGINDPHYALALKSVTLKDGSQQQVDMILTDGDDVAVKVFDPEGRPLSGAHLTMLQIYDPHNGNCFVRDGAFERLNFTPPISDQNGLLTISRLPSESLLVGAKESIHSICQENWRMSPSIIRTDES